MPKSPDAFRTISEVADWLGVQAHVLRFWESKFSQVKPIKRAGGRRYYRPADMLLLGGLKQLLHEDGLTIKGAQKLLREKGVAYVADMSPPLDDLTIAVIEGNAEELAPQTDREPDPVAPQEAAQTVENANAALESELLADEAAAEAQEEETAREPTDHTEQQEAAADPDELQRVPDPEFARADVDDDSVAPVDDIVETLQPVASIEPEQEDEDTPVIAAEQDDDPETADDKEQADVPIMPSFRAHARSDAAPPAPPDDNAPTKDDTDGTPPDRDMEASESAGQETEDRSPDDPDADDTPPEAPRKPRIIDVGPMPVLADMAAEPSAISLLAHLTDLPDADADEIRPLLARLTRLRASMASPRKDVRKD